MKLQHIAYYTIEVITVILLI